MREPDQETAHSSLLNDLAAAEQDVFSLAQRHALSLNELVDWACRPKTRRAIAGLCQLADAQAQLLLSRYRLVAATRLIAHVTADADSLAPEQIRRACIDLLKTELPRAADLDSGEDAEADAAFEALRGALSSREYDSSDDELPNDQTIVTA